MGKHHPVRLDHEQGHTLRGLDPPRQTGTEAREAPNSHGSCRQSGLHPKLLCTVETTAPKGVGRINDMRLDQGVKS